MKKVMAQTEKCPPSPDRWLEGIQHTSAPALAPSGSCLSSSHMQGSIPEVDQKSLKIKTNIFNLSKNTDQYLIISNFMTSAALLS